MKASKRFQVVSVALVSVVGVFQSQTSWTMGKAQPTPKPTSQVPAYTVPSPVREVIVRPFDGVAPLEAPNGVTTTISDSQDFLHQQFVAQLNSNSHFQNVEGASFSSQDGCGTHLEIQPAITEFEMGSTQLNITFGYNQGTLIAIDPSVPKAQGTDTLKIGDIQLSFTVYECPNSGPGNCVSRSISSQANKTVLGNDLNVTVDWSMIHGSLDLLNNSKLMDDLRKIMINGIQQLAANPNVAKLPWQAEIFDVGASGFTFNAGFNQDIQPTDYFTVLTPVSGVGNCPSYLTLGCATAVSSQLSGDSTGAVMMNSAKPSKGDVVQVGIQSSCFGN